MLGMNLLLKSSERIIIVGFLALTSTHMALAQQPLVRSPSSAIAIVNVSVIPMDRERVEAGQTVLVRGDRIVAIGAAGEVPVPGGATVIDGAGRYLVPGLTDAHVHLTTDMPWAPVRPDFGDAPLYLAYGVTTVVNLRGTPTQLEWRRRIEAGELLGPTIYTSGEFVNEPRVNTPEEVQREIVAQAREGYDLIKFHEVWTPVAGYVTTTGLSLPAYLKMIESAREEGIPLVGHAPVNLGLDVLLQTHQSLAHMGMLGNIYFLPVVSHFEFLLVTAGALVVLIVFVATCGVAALIGRWRTAIRRRSATLSRVRSLTGWELLAGLLALACLALFWPAGPLFESVTLRLVFTVLALFIAAATVLLVVLTTKIWRNTNASMLARIQGSLVSIASLALTCALAIFWVPISWRSTNSGIERLAKQLHDAGISVQTTLVVYEIPNARARLRLIQDPAINYLRADTRDRWHRLPQPRFPGYRYDAFMKKVTGALHRAGVSLVAGTDAMGLPLSAPGTSLHRELELLIESGLTPYQAIRAATSNPALFLGKDQEFGTVAVGKRADLLLVGENPLRDLTTLKDPIGVMVRGKWLEREELQRMLAALRAKG